MQRLFKKLKHHTKRQHKRLQHARKHPVVIPIFVFLGLVIVGGAITAFLLTRPSTKFTASNSNIVILSYDHHTQTIPTDAANVKTLLQKLHIAVGKNDRVEPSQDTQIVQDNFHVNIYRAVPVTIYDGDTMTHAVSAAATPRSIVADTGLPLYAEDRVSAGPATSKLDQSGVGQQVTIDRATPVNINVYGTPLALRTHATTVGELLTLKGIKLTKVDSVTPAAATPVTANLQVFVIRKGTQIVSETQSIPAPIQTVTDSSLSFGTSAVRQTGSAGTQVLTYQVNTQNGAEISRTLLQTVVTVQPVTQVVAKGLAVSIPSDKQAVMAQAGIASSDYAYVDYIMSHEGGWCPTKWQGEHSCPAYYEPLHDESSGYGYGIGQATPASKMAAFGDDWRTNVVTQLKWATAYANRSHGGWGGAYDYWISHSNW